MRTEVPFNVHPKPTDVEANCQDKKNEGVLSN